MKQRSFKTVSIILGLVVLGLFILHYLSILQLKNKNENITSLLNEITSQDRKQQYLFSTKKLIETDNTDISRINNSIIASDGDLKFIEDIESLAHQNDLLINIDSLSIDKVPNSSTVVFLKVRAKVIGSWDSNYTFLAKLESLPLKVKIERIDLNNTRSELDNKKISEWQDTIDIRVLKYK